MGITNKHTNVLALVMLISLAMFTVIARADDSTLKSDLKCYTSLENYTWTKKGRHPQGMVTINMGSGADGKPEYVIVRPKLETEIDEKKALSYIAQRVDFIPRKIVNGVEIFTNDGVYFVPVPKTGKKKTYTRYVAVQLPSGKWLYLQVPVSPKYGFVKVKYGFSLNSAQDADNNAQKDAKTAAQLDQAQQRTLSGIKTGRSLPASAANSKLKIKPLQYNESAKVARYEIDRLKALGNTGDKSIIVVHLRASDADYGTGTGQDDLEKATVTRIKYTPPGDPERIIRPDPKAMAALEKCAENDDSFKGRIRTAASKRISAVKNAQWKALSQGANDSATINEGTNSNSSAQSTK